MPKDSPQGQHLPCLPIKLITTHDMAAMMGVSSYTARRLLTKLRRSGLRPTARGKYLLQSFRRALDEWNYDE